MCSRRHVNISKLAQHTVYFPATTSSWRLCRHSSGAPAKGPRLCTLSMHLGAAHCRTSRGSLGLAAQTSLKCVWECSGQPRAAPSQTLIVLPYSVSVQALHHIQRNCTAQTLWTPTSMSNIKESCCSLERSGNCLSVSSRLLYNAILLADSEAANTASVIKARFYPFRQH